MLVVIFKLPLSKKVKNLYNHHNSKTDLKLENNLIVYNLSETLTI